MENNNDFNTRNEDNNSKRVEILKKLYALKESLTGSNESNFNSNSNLNNSTDKSNVSGKAYALTNGHSLLPKENNTFGNWNNGFANALVLGIIVFLTETLFLLIGYLLFK